MRDWDAAIAFVDEQCAARGDCLPRPPTAPELARARTRRPMASYRPSLKRVPLVLHCRYTLLMVAIEQINPRTLVWGARPPRGSAFDLCGTGFDVGCQFPDADKLRLSCLGHRSKPRPLGYRQVSRSLPNVGIC